MSDPLTWGANAPPHSETVDLIARFASDWPAIPLERGQVLFTEGDRSDFLYLIKSGALRIMSGGAIYEDVGPGGIVGEMGIVEESALRSATVVALMPSSVITVDNTQFLALVERAPSFALTVMRVLSRRLRAMNRRYRSSGD
jgi:CRP/FNR family cyclic AMP-dependent transcriptional regulator